PDVPDERLADVRHHIVGEATSRGLHDECPCEPDDHTGVHTARRQLIDQIPCEDRDDEPAGRFQYAKYDSRDEYPLRWNRPSHHPDKLSPAASVILHPRSILSLSYRSRKLA